MLVLTDVRQLFLVFVLKPTEVPEFNVSIYGKLSLYSSVSLKKKKNLLGTFCVSPDLAHMLISANREGDGG